MIHKSLFFTGNPIEFTKGSGLGEIAQPTIGELMDNQMDINDFVEPFYLVMSIKDKVKSSMLNTLYALSERDIKEGNEPVLLKFQRALMLLYHVSEEFIKLDLYGSSQVIIKILDEKHYDIDEKTSKKKYKSKYIIDDNNILFLCETVLEMTDTVVKKDTDDDMIGEPEVIAKFKKYRKMEAERVAEENKYVFYDMCNQIIHMQSQINYKSIMNFTIWQFKNTYNILLSKEVNENVVSSGSVKYNLDNIKDWRTTCKIK